MSVISEMYVEDRPREKIGNRGACALSDKELIAVLIGSGNKSCDVMSIAEKVDNLYREYETVNHRQPGYSDLLKINGIGPARASLLAAAFEFSRRKSGKSSKNRISSPDDVVIAVSDIRKSDTEIFAIFTLNGANEIINRHEISKGGYTASVVHPREVFHKAITDKAVSLILVHNHPSGNLTPSAMDIDTTKRFCDAGALLGINILDHLIVTADDYASMRGCGYI